MSEPVKKFSFKDIKEAVKTAKTLGQTIGEDLAKGLPEDIHFWKNPCEIEAIVLDITTIESTINGQKTIIQKILHLLVNRPLVEGGVRESYPIPQSLQTQIDKLKVEKNSHILIVYQGKKESTTNKGQKFHSFFLQLLPDPKVP